MVTAAAKTRPGLRPTETRPDRTVGNILREARQRRRLTLTAAALATRIPRRHLAALEEGNLVIFRAEVYARGAFTAYAKYLDVYADKNQHAFQRVVSGAREFVPLRVHTPRPWLAAAITPRWVLAAAVAALAAALSGYIIWQAASFFRLPDLKLTQPASSVVSDPHLTVSGHADPQARVAVNGQEVVTDGQGSFTTTLTLHSGINVLQVAATNAAGRTRTLTQDVLLPRR